MLFFFFFLEVNSIVIAMNFLNCSPMRLPCVSWTSFFFLLNEKEKKIRITRTIWFTSPLFGGIRSSYGSINNVMYVCHVLSNLYHRFFYSIAGLTKLPGLTFFIYLCVVSLSHNLWLFKSICLMRKKNKISLDDRKIIQYRTYIRKGTAHRSSLFRVCGLTYSKYSSFILCIVNKKDGPEK